MRTRFLFAALALLACVFVLDRATYAYPPWNGTGSNTTWTTASGTPITNSNWLQASWFIDPISGSDTNAGKTSGAPLKTWARLYYQLWGCFGTGEVCPRLPQNTTVTWLNATPADTDIIYASVGLEAGATLVLQGQLTATQQVATGTLNVVTAKNRATPQLLATTFTTTTGTFALGNFLVNATHASNAFVFAGGPTFTLSQPLVANTAIDPTLWPAEVNTWAAADAITAYTFSNVNIAMLNGVVAKYDGSFENGITIFHLAIGDSTGLNLNETQIAGHVSCVECFSDRKLLYQSYSAQAWIASLVPNSYIKGGLIGGAVQGETGGFPFVAGGVMGKAAGQGSRLVGLTVDQDTIVTGQLDANVINAGTVYIDTSTQIHVLSSANVTNAPSASATQIVWGPGTLNAVNGARVTYPSGAGAAATAFKAALQVNSQTKSCIAQPGAAAIGACNTTLSAANLDTNGGATSDCLVALGGASFCNYGP